MAPDDVIVLRRAYKREQTLRRPYKRGRPPKDSLDYQPPAKPPDPRPKWLLAAIFSGEVRCPRKWSALALEVCAQIQDIDSGGCVRERCCFFGQGASFQAEVEKGKRAGVAPKTGPRGKLKLLATAREEQAGDFAADPK